MAIEQVIEQEAPKDQVDILALYFECKAKYRNVFIYRLGGTDFIYRALGRKEFHDILNDKKYDDFAKEEVICDTCVLWPEGFNFQRCQAGIPTELMKQILSNSYLDSPQAKKNVLEYYRGEMFDLDNQITCMINEAFPDHDIEDIEMWSVDKTMKYLSRAEWKLHNLRGLSFVEPQGRFVDEQEKEEISTENRLAEYEKRKAHLRDLQTTRSEELGINHEKDKPKTATAPQRPKPEQNQESKAQNNNRTAIRGGKRKEKLTPEKLRELMAKFPGIDWAHDDGLKGIEGLEQKSSTSPALWVGNTQSAGRE